jgi:hypothetical protein
MYHVPRLGPQNHRRQEMSHKKRNEIKTSVQARLVTEGPRKARVEEQVPIYRKQASPLLQEVLAQNRGILGLMGLGALDLNPHTLTDLDLQLRMRIADLGATYLVPENVAKQALRLAQDQWPASYLGNAKVPMVVFGHGVQLIPLYIQSVETKTVVKYV